MQVLSLKEDFTFSKFVGLFLDKSESSRLQIEGLWVRIGDEDFSVIAALKDTKVLKSYDQYIKYQNLEN